MPNCDKCGKPLINVGFNAANPKWMCDDTNCISNARCPTCGSKDFKVIGKSGAANLLKCNNKDCERQWEY